MRVRVANLAGDRFDLLVGGALVELAREALEAAGVPALVRLVLLAAVGATVYLGAALWRAPDVTEEVAGVIRRRRPGFRPVEPEATRV